MSVDLDAAATGIKTALSTVPTLKGRVWEYVPERVTVPCAVVVLADGEWEDFSDSEHVTWRILLIVSLANARDAQQRLRSYLRRDGAESVKAALDADLTLSGSVATLDVSRWIEPTAIELGGQDYLGVEVEVAVYG